MGVGPTRSRLVAFSIVGIGACGGSTASQVKPSAARADAPSAWLLPGTSAPLPSAAPSRSAESVTSAGTSGSSSSVPTPVAPRDTRGRVACGDASCDAAREHCCVAGDVLRCVSRDVQCGSEDGSLACDDASDCGAGLTCCRTWACTGGCPMQQVCASAPCDFGEEPCVVGGECRAGLTCAVASGQRDGSCIPSPRPLRCGATVCDVGLSCCWNGAKKQGGCAASCDGDPSQVTSLACTSAADCGGNACGRLIGAPGYSCLGRAVAGDMAGGILCATRADCPPRNVAGAATGCLADRELPPGVKSCRYPE